MNLKRELQTMSITDLRAVCRELGVSCPNTKRGIIKRLLFPLKKKYKMVGFLPILLKKYCRVYWYFPLCPWRRCGK